MISLLFPKPALAIFGLYYMGLYLGFTMPRSLFSVILGIGLPSVSKIPRGDRTVPVIRQRVKTLAEDRRRLTVIKHRRDARIATIENEQRHQRAKLRRSFDNAIMSQATTAIVSPRTRASESRDLGSIVEAQQLALIVRPTESSFNLTVPALRNTIEAQPSITVVQPMKPMFIPNGLETNIISMAHSSTMIWPSVKPIPQRLLLEMETPDQQPSTGVILQGFGPQATFGIPKDDLFGDWRLATGAQPPHVLDSRPIRAVSRSRIHKLILPAELPSADITASAICTSPSPIPLLLVTPPSPTKRNAKLQVIQAKIAKLAQRKKEATSRAKKAARALKNSWTHDAKYRRRRKAKKQAEKVVRCSIDSLDAARKEEAEILLKLERKRRRNGERWAYAPDLED